MKLDDAPVIKKNPNIDKVLIIGSNGNIGRYLIPKLLEMGYIVRALQFNSEVQPREDLEIVSGNTLDIESLKNAVDGVQAVCHMIRGSAGPGETPCEQWFNCCVRGAVNLLDVMKDVKLERYISGSADNVFGHTTIPHMESIHEKSIKRFADGYYGLFKIIEEELDRQYMLGFDIPIVITRFGLIWTDESLEAVVGSLDRKNKIIYRNIDKYGQPLVRHDVHMDDAIQGILLSLERDEAIGEDFNFLSASPYSSTVLTSILHEMFGWPFEDRQKDWNPWTVDISKPRTMLGYRPQVNIMDWLKQKLAVDK